MARALPAGVSRAPSWRSPTTATSSTTSRGWILELDRGHGIPWEGNYSSWLEQKQQRLAQEEKADSARQRTLERELEWVRMSPRARQAKSKARLQAYEELVDEPKQRARSTQLEIAIPPGPRLGDLVVEADGLTKGYGDRLLIDELSFTLPRGGIVGVIGPNGAGKTTLFRMIAGQEKPDGGELRVGDTVSSPTSTRAATRSTPTRPCARRSPAAPTSLDVGKREIHVARLRRLVQLQGHRPAEEGRRRSPAASATGCTWPRLLKSGGNLLLLDEPTNDLDVDTLRALEDALLDFAGCAVVISHDRWFLDRIATHILAFEDEGAVVWFEGNYADYEADRRRRLGAEADQPPPPPLQAAARSLSGRRRRAARQHVLAVPAHAAHADLARSAARARRPT